tara:strand:- start:114 stop:731 length:618 start_codon:yes stop_codon:yes gene_type:complete
MNYQTCKKIVDILVALFLMIFLTPILLIVSILILYELGWPIFFVQKRPGFRNIPFKLIKFRTMRNIFDNQNKLLDDHQRVSSFGKFLRSTSLDELPEIINILRGEMSFIGPRPLLMEYLDLYTQEELKRHSVLPGISGLSQINGRNNLSWKEKFRTDVRYVENQSFLLDLKILIVTFWKVLSRQDINPAGLKSMTKFTGHINSIK